MSQKPSAEPYALAHARRVAVRRTVLVQRRGLALALALLPAAGLSAQAPERTPAQTRELTASAPAAAELASDPAPARVGPTDLVELEGFVDGLMEAMLEAYESAGATVSVVRDGEIVLAKGYGYADLETKEKVDPARTLFRIGSVTKMFTWTALMQQVERGRVDLQADVNTYLEGTSVRVPAGDYPDRPVTPAHLLTHSPGFEDQVIGLFGNEERNNLRPLEQVLAEEMPRRVREPGVISSYSNHGTGLASFIVQRTSGEDFYDYVDRHILEPLGMEHTTLRQPLPARLARDMSKGYKKVGSKLEPQTWEFVPLAGAGSGSSTAVDMAKFMIAHLQLGEYRGARILEEETARLMQSPLLRHDPAVNPIRHGFIDESVNGQTMYGHGGDTGWFHTMWALFPEHDLGLFVSFNSARGGEARSEFVRAFVDHYFPAGEPEELAAPADFADRASRYTGHYRANRYSHGTLAKLAALMGPVEVTATDDGALLVTSGGESKRWIEVAPRTFREEDGEEIMVFRETEAGIADYMFTGPWQGMGFERMSALEGPAVQGLLLGLSMLLFLSVLIGWPALALVRRYYGVSLAEQARLSAPARWSAWGASALFVLFLVAFMANMSDPFAIVFGVPAGLRASLVLPMLGALLALAAAYFAVELWRRRRGTAALRVHYSLAVLAFGVFLWQLDLWNLLGFRF